LKLSICIATYRRAAFIGETLDSVIAQLVPGVEIVVVDGASPDNTREVVERAAARCPALRYYRERENSGADGDYDKAVGYAAGEYCWLLPDDDVLLPGAIDHLLRSLERGPDLVVVNAEVRNADLTKTLVRPRFELSADENWQAGEDEAFFVRAASYLAYIGAVVIRRAAWLERERTAYYGCLFIHMAVIFQRPIGTVRALARPLIAIRNGNAMWTPRGFEIWTFTWPALLWSFRHLSEAAKAAITAREPWRRFRYLLLCRALGSYSMAEFRKHLSGVAHGAPLAAAWLAARSPGALANLAAVLYYGMFMRSRRVELYDLLGSPHAGAASRLAARAIGVYER
jgi:abequosyltransferase